MILGDNKRKTYSRDWPRRFYDISTERKPLVDNRLKAKLPNINHTYSSFSKITRLVFGNRTSRTVLFRGRQGTGSEIVSPGSGPRFFEASLSQFQVPDFSNFIPGSSPRFRKFRIWVPVSVPDSTISRSSGPGPRFPGPGLRYPVDPVPDADPWFFMNSKMILL